MSKTKKQNDRQRARKHEFVWDGRGERGDDARLSVTAGAAATDLRLKEVHFRVLTHLGRFNQKKGWCRLNQADLAKLFGAHRGFVNKCLQQLVSWKYVAKRSQKEAGESFCLYTVILDDTAGTGVDEPKGGVSSGDDTLARYGVSSCDDTPGGGGVSSGDDTCVIKLDDTGVAKLDDTPHSIARARVGHIGDIESKSADCSFGEGTDAASSILAQTRRAAAQAEGEQGSAEIENGDRLPFTPETLQEICALGLEVDDLVAAYCEKTRSRLIKNPNGYLLRMARDAAAKRLGVTPEALNQIATRDRTARAKALGGAVGAVAEPSKAKVRSITSSAKLRGLDGEGLIKDWRAFVAGKDLPDAAAADRSLDAFYASRVFNQRQQRGAAA